MTRIVLIPWVAGARTKNGLPLHSGYTPDRVRWTVEQCIKAAPDLPVAVVTPDPDADLHPALRIDCRSFMQRHGFKECGVMTACFHPDLDHLDIDLVTADTHVLRDPRTVMPDGVWTAPQQHLPGSRPYGDWFMHIPARHPIRRPLFHMFTEHPALTWKFDAWMIQLARRLHLQPELLRPPLVINGEWVLRDWKPWAQPVTEQTAALHPSADRKFPELLLEHPHFAYAKTQSDLPNVSPRWTVPTLPTSLS